MSCGFEVGSFIYHPLYGYGEITTMTDDGERVFVDFRKGHYDWFRVRDLQNSDRVFLVEKAFIRVSFGKGENKGLGIKDILKKYKGYRYIDILF